MKRSAVWWLASLGCVISCGEHWDLRRGVSVVQDQSTFIGAEDLAEKAEKSIQNALSQLESRVVLSSANVLHVAYKEKCTCSQCGPYTVAIAAPFSYTIYICPYAKANPTDFVDAGMKHELLHTLAHRGDHLPCETGAVMTPEVACETHLGVYTKADISYLCEGGYVSGGVCASTSLP